MSRFCVSVADTGLGRGTFAQEMSYCPHCEPVVLFLCRVVAAVGDGLEWAAGGHRPGSSVCVRCSYLGRRRTALASRSDLGSDRRVRFGLRARSVGRKSTTRTYRVRARTVCLGFPVDQGRGEGDAAGVGARCARVARLGTRSRAARSRGRTVCSRSGPACTGHPRSARSSSDARGNRSDADRHEGIDAGSAYHRPQTDVAAGRERRPSSGESGRTYQLADCRVGG